MKTLVVTLPSKPRRVNAREKRLQVMFKAHVLRRISAGLPEDDEGDDFNPWVWKILLDELLKVIRAEQ